MFDTEDFISMIQSNECIWNKQESSHHDLQALHVGWTNVARACLINFDEMEDKIKTEKIKELKLKWKNIRDTFRKKCIKKSGQAANNEKKYVYANILQFLRPTMENRRTESNVIESEPEEENEDESEIVMNVEDPDVCVVDSEVKTPKSLKQKSVKRPKMSFEDNLLQMLKGRKVEDPVSSFLMSLAPQIRMLNQEKQNQIFIEFLQTIQRVSSTNPNQSTYIPPTANNVVNWPIQHRASTFYDRSYNTYPTAINHHPNHLDITPASSSLTSSGLDPYQLVSPASDANPHQYYDCHTNSSQTVTAPGSPSTTPFNYSRPNNTNK